MCESLVRFNVALEPTTRVIFLSDTKQFDNGDEDVYLIVYN